MTPVQLLPLRVFFDFLLSALTWKLSLLTMSAGSPSMATPPPRKGPSSRLLQRRSLLLRDALSGKTPRGTSIAPAVAAASPSEAPERSLLHFPDEAEVTRVVPYVYQPLDESAALGEFCFVSSVLGGPVRPHGTSLTSETVRHLTNTFSTFAHAGDKSGFSVLATENLFVDFVTSSTNDEGDGFSPDRMLDQVAEYEELLEEHLVRLKKTTEVVSVTEGRRAREV